jgi:hypothetical protein
MAFFAAVSTCAAASSSDGCASICMAHPVVDANHASLTLDL